MSGTTASTHAAGWNIWPVSIISFFALALLGFGAFIWFCTRHPADLVAADYYEQELRYQGQIDRLQNTQAGAAVTVSFDAANRRIVISAPGAANATGRVQLYRPSAANLDRQFEFEPDAKGVQRIETAGLLPGLWKVRVSWTAGGRDYYVDQKVVVGVPAS